MAENKKDSFTFSDKIKNSKPAFNPFSKRVSSKVGNNGKPKKTLFERTRRDAPFFVAAAAALLMLPFLYKYSGSVEDGAIITPGTDSVFEPDRSGFDPSIEDPSAQIAQLSVRDPLSLIKGWGDPEPAPSMGSYDRDGLDDTYTPPTPRSSYRDDYRPQAPANTRASFQRNTPAPTKVNPLGSASMNFRGGGGGFGRFGGANLKTAAKASSAPAPKAGVKPVSLQPLRSAGNPSRSYFGQGSAAQARASRDAMGKANALQALNDAMYDPLKANQAPLGGLGGGDFVGGAGAGKWDPHSEYKGITPWWWDMMKQQEMEKWKWEYFLWRKGLVEPLIKGLADMTLKFADPFLSCLITGTDDWSMGSMGGTKGSDGSLARCECDGGGTYYDVKQLAELLGNQAPQEDADLEDMCGTPKAKNDYGCSWKKGSSATGKMSWFGRRRHCLNEDYAGKFKTAFSGKDAQMAEAYDCEQMANHTFVLKPGAKYSEDEGYDESFHIVIAKNIEIADGKKLCQATKLNTGKVIAGVNAGKDNHGASSAKNAGKSNTWLGSTDVGNTDDFRSNGSEQFEGTERPYYGEDYEKYQDACVVYVAEGKVFNHDNYKLALKESVKAAKIDETGGNKTKRNTQEQYKNSNADELTGKIIPIAVEGFVMKKDTLDRTRTMREKMPMAYKDFLAEYVEGEEFGNYRCDCISFSITALPIGGLDDIRASLACEDCQNISVSVQIKDGNGNVLINTKNPTQVAKAEGNNPAVYSASLTAEEQEILKNALQGEGEDVKKIVAYWTATKGDEKDTDSAEYSSGQEVTVEQPKQTEPATPSPSEVSFYNTVAEVMGATDLLALRSTGTATSNPSYSCNALQTIEGKKLIALDADIKKVLEDAKKAYNDKNKDANSILKYDENNISVANLLDAMAILHKKEGNYQAPLNAVCMLGKTIGANSKDGKYDTFNNMFGTFAAFMGEDSSFFPAQFAKIGNDTLLDKRFVGCSQGNEVNGNKAYHYGHYNWNHEELGDQKDGRQDDRAPFEEGLRSGIWKEFPLKPIANAVGFVRNQSWDSSQGAPGEKDSMDAQNRKKYHTAYKDVFQTDGGCKLSGTMSYDGVKKYVETLCQSDLGQKPTNGNNLECNAEFLADNNAY